MSELLNHPNLSDALDVYARSIPNRPPLQRDEKLYAAFTQDREETVQ
ncbi:hypothetical protein ACRAJ3_25115 [Rhodococcus pyridinivorans]